jgi:hypothetical protein
MSADISTRIQARLSAMARSEGLSIDALLERLLNEREELAAIIEATEAHFAPVSREDIQDKLERGFAESKRGEVADGDAFTAQLLRELDEMERNRRVG